MALAAAGSACAAEEPEAQRAATAATEMRITVWPRGEGGASRAWTLRCDPAGGSLPRAARACRTLGALRSPFRPVPPGSICTQVYGGPAVARVRGTFRGRRVDTRFDRRDGCRIARWNRVRVLFPVAV